MLIHSPRLCCLNPPLFRYCPCTFLYLNAPDASSRIQSAKLSCWPQCYVGLSSGRLAYAGQQAGVSFVVAYAALSPSANFYEPLWRVWGIFLGLIIVTGVFLLVAPEYAGKALVPRLKAILQGTLELLRPEKGLTEEGVQEIDMQATCM